MTPHYDRAVIIGVGLLGASLGLALKQRKFADRIVGVGRRPESLKVALESGAIDQASLDPVEACTGAPLIVIATPAGNVMHILDAIRPVCIDEAVVTDVASTKAAICAHATATWPKPRRFVGSHPMAGSEKFGPQYGDANLYSESVCLVETAPDIDLEARKAICTLWEAVGARVVDVDPAQHDAILAHTSHLPHAAAAAIALAATRYGDVQVFSGGGLRDTTRIAAGRPEIWRDICMTNRDALLVALTTLRDHLASFRDALDRCDDEAVLRFFEDACDARKKIVPE